VTKSNGNFQPSIVADLLVDNIFVIRLNLKLTTRSIWLGDWF